MESHPSRRYTNGSINETLATRLLQCLSETELDRWDEDLRQEMKANLQWVSRHRASEGTRRRYQTILIAGAFTIMAAFVSWIAPWKTTPACPPNYACTQTPISTPTP